jgi:hypothetical protein
MSSYAETVAYFYNGEVLGEAVYSALCAKAETADERVRMATLLQLETETKAWLRPHALALGISIEERAADREEGLKIAERLKALSWRQLWQALHHGLSAQVVPHFRALAVEAAARGDAREIALCRFMIEHEDAQVEFCRRTVAGEDLATCLEPVAKHLRVRLSA